MVPAPVERSELPGHRHVRPLLRVQDQPVDKPVSILRSISFMFREIAIIRILFVPVQISC